LRIDSHRTSLGASFGHVARLIPMARHFQRHGDHVELVVRDPRLLAETIGAGALACRAAPHLTPDPRPRPLSLNYADSLVRNGYGEPDALAALVDRWIAVFEHTRPDLVILEHAPGALLAASEAGLAAIVVGSGFTVPPIITPQPTIQPWFEVPEAELLRRERRLVASVNAAMAGRRMPPIQAAADLFANAARHVCTWPELDHYEARPADEYAGPIGDLEGEPVTWPPGGGPRVFFYGYGDGLLRVLAHAAARGCRCVVYRPNGAADAGDAGSSVVWLKRPADLARSAETCDLAVCEAPGAATQFLLAGVPVLMLPRHLEQELWAYRAARRGLVESVSLFSTGAASDPVAAFGRALASDSLRSRATDLATTYRGRDDDVLHRIVGGTGLESCGESLSGTGGTP